MKRNQRGTIMFALLMAAQSLCSGASCPQARQAPYGPWVGPQMDVEIGACTWTRVLYGCDAPPSSTQDCDSCGSWINTERYSSIKYVNGTPICDNDYSEGSPDCAGANVAGCDEGES